MRSCPLVFHRLFWLLLACVVGAAAQQTGLQPDDLHRFRAAGSVQISPDATHIAYEVSNPTGPGRPFSQLYVMDVQSGRSIRFGGPNDPSGNAVWSPDNQWLAYEGEAGDKSGLLVAHADGTGVRFVSEMQGTNSPEPGTGRSLSWSPDSKSIAFVSAVPGPEAQAASGDPMVITRYLYKPTAGEGLTHFNDNRRLHIFVADLASGQVHQLTSGNGYEHSIDWSPAGDKIVYAAEHGFDADRFFNYDLFTVNPSDGTIHQLTSTEGVEYEPVWSPDGSRIAFIATKRGLTDRETNMEDTHVWIMAADGSTRRELGATIDNRQGAPQWTPDGTALLCAVQERGSAHLYRFPLAGGTAARVGNEGAGIVNSFSIARNGTVAYSMSSPGDLAEVYLLSARAAARKLTSVNDELQRSHRLAPVESFSFISNDNKWNIDAFLTLPLDFAASNKYPLIVDIHGGPHGQQGPALNLRNQIYAAHGYAVLNVNYRGSTGYGQAFADAVFRDQDGDEGNDVLWAVNAAIRRYPWIDPQRMGIEGVSYGGQLTDWLITQTNAFKAAIPIAGISNFISYNYMTYYNQYEAMEWGAYPHQNDLMNILWERSALKHVANVHTPTLIMHGENDPDVPIAEAEQYFIALQDVGVETVFVRYPREGHGLSEIRHQVDSIERAFQWYDSHFRDAKPAAVTLP